MKKISRKDAINLIVEVQNIIEKKGRFIQVFF